MSRGIIIVTVVCACVWHLKGLKQKVSIVNTTNTTIHQILDTKMNSCLHVWCMCVCLPAQISTRWKTLAGIWQVWSRDKRAKTTQEVDKNGKEKGENVKILQKNLPRCNEDTGHRMTKPKNEQRTKWKEGRWQRCYANESWTTTGALSLFGGTHTLHRRLRTLRLFSLSHTIEECTLSLSFFPSSLSLLFLFVLTLSRHLVNVPPTIVALHPLCVLGAFLCFLEARDDYFHFPTYLHVLFLPVCLPAACCRWS